MKLIRSLKDVFDVSDHQTLDGSVVNLSEALAVWLGKVYYGASAKLSLGIEEEAGDSALFAVDYGVHSIFALQVGSFGALLKLLLNCSNTNLLSELHSEDALLGVGHNVDHFSAAYFLFLVVQSTRLHQIEHLLLRNFVLVSISVEDLAAVMTVPIGFLIK